MEKELAIQAFEQIDNYILQLLLWSLGIQVLTLAGAVAYLFRNLSAINRDAVERERDITAALTDAAQGYENLRDELREVKQLLTFQQQAK